MEKEALIIAQAEFNPRIKKYLLFIVAFYLFISVAGIPLLLIWYLGLGQNLSKRYYENLKCRLTDSHLEFKKGILFRVERPSHWKISRISPLLIIPFFAGLICVF
jgi:putative membrane protein